MAKQPEKQLTQAQVFGIIDREVERQQQAIAMRQYHPIIHGDGSPTPQGLLIVDGESGASHEFQDPSR